MSDVTVGSLFSGIGGIELGLEMAGGYRTKWFVERDPYATAVLNKHWPGTPVYPDIRHIDWATVEPVDMLTGGFPCQDISNAGKRKGITGKRSGLWKEYLRAIRSLRPRIVLVENVSALTNRGLDVVLGDLSEAGYDAEWFDLRASDVGAPHRRERLFIVAHSDRAEPGDEPTTDTGPTSQVRRETESHVPATSHNPRPTTDVADPSESGQSREEQLENDKEGERGGPDVPYTMQGGLSPQGSEQQAARVTGNNQEVPDADCRGLEGQQSAIGGDEAYPLNGCDGRRTTEPRLGGVVDGISRGLHESGWPPEPEGVPRVTQERKHRKERIMCLGNAVVPQCAYVIGMAIKERRAR